MSKIKDTNLRDRIYETIRNKILKLDFQPGERIPELQLSEELGVSRPLIREATRRLSWEGLVEIHPNYGAKVIIIDDKTIQDLAFVRWQHDQLAIPLAIFNASYKDITDLRNIANSCITANVSGNIELRHDSDALFHQRIIQLSGNHILCDLHYRTSLIVRLWQAIHITTPETLASGLQQHLELVDYIEQRNITAALQVIHDHTMLSFGSDFTGDLLSPQDLLQLCQSN